MNYTLILASVLYSDETRTTADRRPWSFRAFKVLFDDFECVITMVLNVNVFFGLFMALCHAEMAKLMVLPQRGVNFGGFGKRRNYFHRAFIFSSSSGHSNASNSSRNTFGVGAFKLCLQAHMYMY